MLRRMVRIYPFSYEEPEAPDDAGMFRTMRVAFGDWAIATTWRRICHCACIVGIQAAKRTGI